MAEFIECLGTACWWSCVCCISCLVSHENPKHITPTKQTSPLSVITPEDMNYPKKILTVNRHVAATTSGNSKV